MKRLLTIFIVLISAISACIAQDSEMKRIKVILRGYVVLDTLVNSKEEITILDLSAPLIPSNRLSSNQATTKDPQITHITPTQQTQSSNGTNNTDKANSTVSVKRCAATTKKGKQCSRNAAPGSNYCWQHK